MKIFISFLGLSLFAFIVYLFVSGNVALAIIIALGSLIFLPLAIMAIKGRLSFSEVSHDSSDLHASGGTSGGVGPS